MVLNVWKKKRFELLGKMQLLEIWGSVDLIAQDLFSKQIAECDHHDDNLLVMGD